MQRGQERRRKKVPCGGRAFINIHVVVGLDDAKVHHLNSWQCRRGRVLYYTLPLTDNHDATKTLLLL